MAHIGCRRKKRVVGHVFPRLKRHNDVAHLRHTTAKHRAIFFRQPLFSHRTGCDHGRSQAGGGAATAARVAQAVFVQIGVIGMARAEGVQNIAVVFAALVGVFDEQANRRTGGFAFINAAQNLDRIGFVALGDEF